MWECKTVREVTSYGGEMPARCVRSRGKRIKALYPVNTLFSLTCSEACVTKPSACKRLDFIAFVTIGALSLIFVRVFGYLAQKLHSFDDMFLCIISINMLSNPISILLCSNQKSYLVYYSLRYLWTMCLNVHVIFFFNSGKTYLVLLCQALDGQRHLM